MKLRIEKAVYGGAGLGRAAGDSGVAGKTVFVPHTLAGELVECEIIDDRRSFANARLISVIEPAAGRVTPGCEYFPACGGCQYQHASYDAQIAMKRSILAETMGRAGIALANDAIEVLRSGPWEYRNRVRLHIRFGDSALCYREAASHRNVAVDHCPIAAPLLQTAIRAFPEAAQACGLEAGLFDEVEFFTNAEENTLLVSLWTTRGTARTRAFPGLCEALLESLPSLAGAVLFQTETQKGQGRQQAAWGNPELFYTVGEDACRVSAGSFFQVNRWLLPAMLSRVVANKTGKLAWDLFAGVGLFARPLAGAFEQVVAVEQAASSVRDLRHNLQGGKHRVVASATLDFLKQQVRDRTSQPPALAVVDPPRAGLGNEVTALLSQIGPANVTYISCDPSTLARDVQQLLHSGYQLKNITLVDLFPETFHLETIAELVRSG
jgi:23S rRNA (uracil1939-C5)-methyltransferase